MLRGGCWNQVVSGVMWCAADDDGGREEVMRRN